MSIEDRNREAELVFHSFVIPQVASSVVSFVTSSAVLIMVVRSRNGGLQTPYRRIIFGMSASDMFQSFALMTGPWSVQAWMPVSWGIGNGITCKLNGSLLTIGMNSVPIYTTLLCLYYLCKLKYRMSDEAFSRRFEYIFHAFIILFNLIVVPTALAMKVFNPTLGRSYCHFSKVPLACGIMPDTDCDPVIAKRVSSFNQFLTIAWPLTNICIILIIMAMLCLHAISFNKHFQVAQKEDSNDTSTPAPKEKQVLKTAPKDKDSDTFMPRAFSGLMLSNIDVSGWENEDKSTLFPDKMLDLGNSSLVRLQPYSGAGDDHDSSADHLITESDCEAIQFPSPSPSPSSSNNSVPQNELESDAHADRARNLYRLFKYETLLQVTCYVAAFAITYLPFTTSYLLLDIGIEPARPLLYFAFGVYPLQGIFNILIYSRPEVASLHRKHPGISWLRAFWLVLRSGGEMPNDDMIATNLMRRSLMLSLEGRLRAKKKKMKNNTGKIPTEIKNKIGKIPSEI